MFLKIKEITEAIVVCEHRLSGQCFRDSCPAYKENKLNAKECHQLDTGQYYYNYSCSEGEANRVKLLDILFVGNPGKINPNFAFRRKKRELHG